MERTKPLDPAKTVLITGAAGFIGFHLAKRLLAAGIAVVGVDDLNDYYDPELKKARLAILDTSAKFTFYKLDISDAGAVEVLFSDARPDVVVNLAAQAGVRYSIENPSAYIRSNVQGFFNILEACRRYPVEHLVYASSSSVYGNRTNAPFSETDNVDHPASLYAATKKSNELMAYTYAHLYQIPSTGLRFFTVYGPFGRPDMAYFSFTQKILAGQTIKVFNNGDLYRDFTYIDDIVEGVTRLLFAPPAPDASGSPAIVYNIGNNHPEKLDDFIRTLEQAWGKTADKEYLPMQDGDVYMTAADITRLKQDFGFVPTTTIAEGLPRFVEWYRGFYCE